MSANNKTLSEHTSHITVVFFSADGDYLLSAGMDNLIHVWDVEDGFSLKKSFEVEDRGILAMALSPDEETLAVAGEDRTIRLFSFPDFELLDTWQGHKDPIAAIAFSPDGTLVATAGADTQVRLWDRATGTCRQTFQGHRRNVTSLLWINDDTLASSGLGDQLFLWDIQSGDGRLLDTGHKASIMFGGLTPFGDEVITAGYEGQLKIWDTDTWELLTTFEPGVAGHLALDLAPYGTMLAIGSDKYVAIYSVESQERLVRIPVKPRGVHAVAFSPEARWLAAATADKTIRLWLVDTIV